MAERKVRHEVALTGEKQYKAALKDIETGFKNVKSSVTVLNAEYGKNDKSVMGLTKRQELLTRELDLQQKKAATIKAEFERVAAAQGENSEKAQKLARDYDYARAATIRTEKELKTLRETTDKATSKFEQFKQKLNEGGGALEKVGKKISDAGMKMTKFATAPIVAGFGAAAKSAMDFETEVSNLDTLTKGEIGMDKLGKDLLEVSSDINMAVGELAKTQYTAISSGIKLGDSLDYAAGAAKAAKAGMSDVSTVVKGSTSIVNAWRMEGERIPLMFDQMILSLDLGKAELEDLAGQIGQLTGLAPGLKVSFEEILAGISALSMTQDTSTAVNGLKNILSGVLKPTKEAQKEAKALGLEFNAAAVQSKGLAAFLQDVVDKTGGSEEKFAKLFGSVQGLSAALTLTGSAAEDFKNGIEELGNAAGTVDRIVGRQNETQAARFAKSWNRMQNSMIRFGMVLAPVVEAIGAQFERLAAAAEKLDDGQLKFVAGLLAVVAAAGPAVVGLGKIVTAVGQVKTVLGALSAVGGGPLGAIVIGAAAAVAGIVLLQRHLESLQGTSKIKAAFKDMTIDTKAIDEAITAAEGITHDLKITADAKVKLAGDSASLHAEIVKWLTDGKVETPEQKKAMLAKANEVVAPVYDAIEEAFKKKKKKLDEQLAGGIIDQATYEARLKELKKTTDEAKSSLETEAAAYAAYVKALADAGANPTQEQLDKLDELRQKIVDVGQELLEAQNIATQAARAGYIRTVSGGGSKEDIAVGTAYVQAEADIKIANVKSAKEAAMADLAVKWDKAKTEEEKMKVVAEMDLEEEIAQKSIDAIEAELSNKTQKMIEGIGKKYPKQAEALKKIGEKQNLVEELMGPIVGVRSSDQEVAAKAQAELNRLFEQIYGEKPSIVDDNTWAMDMVEELKQGIASEINQTDMTPMFEDFSTAISSGALNGLDLTSVEGAIGDMITAIDLVDDGKTVGEQLIAGEIEGIAGSQDKLNTAIKTSVEAGNKALRSAQGIQSPSAVWHGYGLYMMQGLAGGITAGTGPVKAAVRLLTAKLRVLGEDAIQGLINGANSKRAALVNTFGNLGNAAHLASKNALKSSSPSKKFMELGNAAADGMIIQTKRRTGEVQRAMRDMVNPDDFMAPRGGGGMMGFPQPAAVGGGGSSTVVVNYTGSVTRRDSRRLSAELGGYLDRERKGKGR